MPINLDSSENFLARALQNCAQMFRSKKKLLPYIGHRTRLLICHHQTISGF